ncbi:hypothetical protein AAF712_007070 [Marasmius tenuissimus]|uniref:F-box domain-containing protein n=1 Tax=Marasmius tenuissimus TaxID=585030 RepID=A0ABR2ZYR9_9AGAR
MVPTTHSAPPIHRLPVEIMGRVLQCAIGDTRDTFGPTIIRRGRQIPWSEVEYLSEVCTRWENILLSSPDFWASISLYINFYYDYSDDIITSLKRHLTRSGNAPLDIELIFEWNGPPRNSEEDVSIFKAFLQPILDEAHRWRHLCFAGQYFAKDFMEHILLPLESQLSTLESFDYGVVRMGSLDTLTAFGNALGPSNTSFRTLRLYTEGDAALLTMENLTHISEGFPFASIRYLYLFNTLHGSLAFINLCPNLVTAHFVIPSLGQKARQWADLPMEQPRFADVSAKRPCRLSNLRELKVEITYISQKESDYPFEDVACIFASIEAPALTSFGLLSDSNRLRDPLDLDVTDERGAFTSSLHALLSKYAGVDKLLVLNVPIRDDELIVLLDKMPNLKTLEIKEIDKVRVGDEPDDLQDCTEVGSDLDSLDSSEPEEDDVDDGQDVEEGEEKQQDDEEGEAKQEPSEDEVSDEEDTGSEEEEDTGEESWTSIKPNTIVTANLLSWLTWSAERTSLPELRTIRLVVRDFSTLQTSFENMFESRLPPLQPPLLTSPRIRVVDSAMIKFTQEGHKDYDWSRLRSLQAKGLAIRMLFEGVTDDDSYNYRAWYHGSMMKELFPLT